MFGTPKLESLASHSISLLGCRVGSVGSSTVHPHKLALAIGVWHVLLGDRYGHVSVVAEKLSGDR